MSASIEMTGTGTVGDIVSWTVREDGTPATLASSAGAPGSASIEARTTATSRFTGDNTVKLSTNRGSWYGTVTEPSIERATTTLTAQSFTSALDVDKTAQPMAIYLDMLTLDYAIRYYCGLCGIDSSQIVIDSTIGNQLILFPGWRGNVWVKLKELAAVYLLEIVVVNDKLTFRPRASKTLDLSNYDALKLSVDTTGYARTFKMMKYTNSSVKDWVVYPEPKTDPKEATIIQVDRDEVWRQRVTLKASLVSVNQPFAINTSPFPYTFGQSTYTIIGNDNLPVAAQFWTDFGGKVEVALTENPFEIEITVQGPNTSLNAPYRLGVSDGDEVYNTLYITGQGVESFGEEVTFPTAAPDSSQEVGVTIDCPFIGDNDKFYAAAFALAASFGNPQSSISTGTMKTGVGNPGFSEVSGAKIIQDGVNYRSDTNNISAGAVRTTASRYVTDNDLRSVWAGKTDDNFRTVWAGWSNRDMSLQPLRKA